jgi:hypothetical protein
MQTLLDDRALLARLEATSLARVGRLKAKAVVSRIEQVYRDVLLPAPADVTMEAYRNTGEPSCR